MPHHENLDHSDMVMYYLEKENRTLRAENERLREALKSILDSSKISIARAISRNTLYGGS